MGDKPEKHLRERGAEKRYKNSGKLTTVRHEGDPVLLNKYFVLDLTDDKGLFCTKILADLGADVVRIDKPVKTMLNEHKVDQGESWLHVAYNVNKRSVTLNIESGKGRSILKKLARKADVLVESFPPGYMDKIGIGYGHLRKVNPRLVMASITPFGQTGPYRDFQACDMTLQAMGGIMAITGPPDKPPTRVGLSTAYLLGSAYAAVGTLVALYHQKATGKGQHIDVSLYEGQILTTGNMLPFWYLNRVKLNRMGHWRPVGIDGSVRQRQIYPCKDGFVSFGIYGGPMGAKSNRALVKAIENQGQKDEYLSSVDWDEYDMAKTTDDQQLKMIEYFANFFLSRTKDELYSLALREGIQLFPVSTLQDLLQSEQLAERRFWKEISIKGKARVKYPGFMARLSEKSISSNIPKSPPVIGGHNEEIYLGELKFSRNQLSRLKEEGII